MKIEKLDKKDFKRFKKIEKKFIDKIFCREIYFYLQDYVKKTFHLRFRGLCVYGFTTIKISDKCKSDFFAELKNISNDSEKAKIIEYFVFMEHIAEILNKYIVRFEEPTYKHALINYEFMINILQDIPWFHDAYPVNVKKIEKDVYIKFCLYASRISNENRRIYRLNPLYRGDDNTIFITIKFNGVELIKGLLEEAYMLNRNYNFLWDLDYEVIDKETIKFDLFTIAEYELIFNCKNIDFIEQESAEVIFREIDNLILFEMLKFGPVMAIPIESRKELQQLDKEKILKRIPLLEQLQHDIFGYVYNDYNSVDGTFKTPDEEVKQIIISKYNWLNETNIKKLMYQGKYYAWHG